jgi:hydroxyacylglutathione hydrolase
MCPDKSPQHFRGHSELRKREPKTCKTPLKDLIIAHSHSHSDHTAGDLELSNFTSPYISKVTLIPPSNTTAITTAFNISTWPIALGSVGLGPSRTLDIIPLPGHQTESIAVFDKQSGLLLAGDSLYPGRIYIPQSAISTFKASHRRLTGFVRTREISWVLGCHIEQKSTPFEDYPEGTVWQPKEHRLQFPVSVLEDVAKALDGIDDDADVGQIMFAEFSLVIKKG